MGLERTEQNKEYYDLKDFQKGDIVETSDTIPEDEGIHIISKCPITGDKRAINLFNGEAVTSGVFSLAPKNTILEVT